VKALLASLLFWAGQAHAGATEPGFLHTRGRDIVNEKGEKVMLQGVGLGNWLLPEGYMWRFGAQADRPRRMEDLIKATIGLTDAERFWGEFRRNYITEADVQQIARLGFNSVRLPLNSRLFLPNGAEPEPEGFRYLDHLVSWCGAAGIYVVIDMHGAPGGQTGQNIDDSAADKPELFMLTRYQEELVALWRTLALRYRNRSAVAGYDLLNEPLPARTGALARYKGKLLPLYKRLTAAIREVDPRHMVILEGADWSNDWSIFDRPFDSNVVYEFHYYCWDTPARLKSLQRYLDYGQRFNVPIWAGETGERDEAIYWATTDYFEENDVGWAFWPWKKMEAKNAPYSFRRPEGWDSISAFSRGGPKPSADTARKAFDELLANIPLDRCDYHPGVVNALFRRAPARIEAENFGHRGSGISYSVTNQALRSKFFRLDQPVTIIAPESQRSRSGQYIVLSAAEWTGYTIGSDSVRAYQIKARVRGEGSLAEAKLLVNGQSLNVRVSTTDWADLDLGTISFKQGSNQLKWVVTRGKIDLDWISVELLAREARPTGLDGTPRRN
jgi:aryl-phospho-beta-D-glucosidase BglC (GH1 family)